MESSAQVEPNRPTETQAQMELAQVLLNPLDYFQHHLIKWWSETGHETLY